MSVTQFESPVEGDIIRVPKEYIGQIPSMVTVSFVNVEKPRNCRAEAGALLPDDFTALKLDTRGWKFDREEANERR
jgi:hypothetical protein